MIEVRQPPGVATAANAPSLLAAGYRGLTAVCESLQVGIAAQDAPTAPGQVTAAELVDDPDLTAAFVGGEAERLLHRHGRPVRRDVAASRALHAYAWNVSLLMSGAWYREHRVPRVRPQDVRVSLATGALEVTVSGAFACLPDDPARELPGVRVLPHEEALHAELRAAVADHVRPLLAAVGPHIRRGPRALWGMIGDDLVSGVWYLGRVLGEEERALARAEALLPTALPPFPDGAGFRRLAAAGGRSYPTRTRSGCCLYYTIEPADACLTCPRTCDAERLRRLTDEDAS
ncbi:iron-sulfur protein [Streptomyces armeniacus]|uniref:Iron-sulfur protein n=1 Tax=Streptomyces armeniacus TaxID=83291 RepID=A0A345XXT7_9ACTN|nr:(2Fe-2S)-binding protein [Streptomyces armeniacus]AXK36453.1 iron-sulfur protein [Streptomyces armeniacus]